MGESRYGQWELYDGRLSRTVLRGALGETPEVYSLSDYAIWRPAMRLNGAGFLRGRYTRLAMSPLLLPFRLVLLVFAGWVNRHQLDVIEYLQEENRVFKERLGGLRLRFTAAERRRLAEKRKHSGARC
jgi:hypothetical protein